ARPCDCLDADRMHRKSDRRRQRGNASTPTVELGDGREPPGDGVHEQCVQDVSYQTQRMKRVGPQTEKRPGPGPDDPGERLIMADLRRRQRPSNGVRTAEMVVLQKHRGIVPVDEGVAEDRKKYERRHEDESRDVERYASDDG